MLKVLLSIGYKPINFYGCLRCDMDKSISISYRIVTTKLYLELRLVINFIVDRSCVSVPFINFNARGNTCVSFDDDFFLILDWKIVNW